ncbi:MAG: fluoride efflux transporter CrcB [Abditibacteriaceae bacterium]
MKIIWMMVAGGFGVGARYAMTLGVQNWLSGVGARGWLAHSLGTTFPLGTLLINVSGAFLLALITMLALQEAVPPELRLILGTGFLGAFTTFSTFELEAQGLLSGGQWTQASVYILGNLLLGFVAVLLGSFLALRLTGGLAGGNL